MSRSVLRRIVLALVIITSMIGSQLFAECSSSPVNVSQSANLSYRNDMAVSGNYVYVVWSEQVSATNHDVMLKVSTNHGKSFGFLTNLSSNGGFLAAPQVAASGASVYVVWLDGTAGNFQVLFRASSDYGASFSATQSLGTAGDDAGYAQIAVSNGIIFVTYGYGNTPSTNDIWLRASTDGGASFSPALNVSDNAGDSTFAELVASAGNAYVVWRDRTANTSQILFREVTNSGTTVGVLKTLSNPGLTVSPQIEVAGTAVYVVWQDSASGAADVFFSASYDDGGNFSPVPQNISSNNTWSMYPRLAASGPNVYVVWQDGTPGDPGDFDILFKASPNGGMNFNAFQNLSNVPGESLYPKIAAAGNQVWVAWSDATPSAGGVVLASSTNAGGSFDPVSVSLNGSISDSLQLLASDDHAYMSWVDQSSGVYDVFVSTTVHAGKPFGGNVNVSNNPAASNGPKIAVSCDNVYVAWADFTFGQGHYFFKASHDNGATFGPYFDVLDPALSIPADMTIAASGNYVYLAWDKVVGNAREIFVKASSDYGNTFGDAVNASNISSFSVFPQLSAQGNRVYVSWIEGSGAATNEVYFSRSTNAGVSFEPAHNVSNTASDSDYHQLASAGDKVYVVWNDGAGLMYNVSHNAGQTFLGPFTMPGGLATTPSRVAASGDDVYIISNSPGPNLYSRRSTNGGLSFNAPVQVSNNGGFLPELAISGSNVYVLWLETSGGIAKIFFRPSTNQGSSFGDIVTITPNPGNFAYKKLGASRSQVYVTWLDESLGNQEEFIRVSYDEGKGFSNALNLSVSPGNCDIPELVAFDGSVYVAWRENDIGGHDILLRAGIPSIGGVLSQTGAGTVSFATTAGGFSSITALPVPPGQPANTSFPFGFFGWTLTGLTLGQTATVTLTYPTNIPIGAEYWKVISGVWVNMPPIVLGSNNDGDNVLTLTIQDGGIGDVDGLMNGEISDPGGVALFVQQIAIDIDPQVFPNTIDLTEKRLLPVAVLTTPRFNAANVDRSQVRFGASGMEAGAMDSSLQDVDRDGDVDLLLHFDVADTRIACGHTSATLTGTTRDGIAIKGTDSIRTDGCR